MENSPELPIVRKFDWLPQLEKRYVEIRIRFLLLPKASELRKIWPFFAGLERRETPKCVFCHN